MIKQLAFNLIEPWVPLAGLLAGFCAVLFINARTKKNEFVATVHLNLAAFAATFVAAEYFIVGEYFGFWGVVIAFAAGVFCGFYWLRKSPAWADGAAQLFSKKTSVERNKKTDVREIATMLPSAASKYNPTRFFNKKKVFLGLGVDKSPVALSREAWPTMPHIQVVGTTGAGKGVFIGLMAAQWLKAGEAVFMIDPKDDEWAPHVFAEAAADANAAHHFINLREDVPQFSIFSGATAAEIEELFIAGFGFADTGKASDFYSISDRRYSRIIAQQIAAEGLTPAQAYERNAKVLEDEAPKLAGKLRELGEVSACNAAAGQGVSFQEVIENGGSVYIVGHMRAEKIVRLQKMLLVRLLQIAESRDRIGGALRPVGIILDEVKYHLSRSSLEALGASRDKGVHVLLAHQSLADLKDCSADLDGDAVVGSIVENCRIKIVYRVVNPETAEWLARMSGTVLVDDEVRVVEKNVVLAESVTGNRTIRQAERFFIDENMLLNLPKGVAVVFGDGLAKFISVANLKVEKAQENVKVVPVFNSQTQDETKQFEESFL